MLTLMFLQRNTVRAVQMKRSLKWTKTFCMIILCSGGDCSLIFSGFVIFLYIIFKNLLFLRECTTSDSKAIYSYIQR